MHIYRCYFRARTGHIQALEVIRCSGDDAARQMAARMIRERPDYHAVELWDLGRQIVRLTGADDHTADVVQANPPPVRGTLTIHAAPIQISGATSGHSDICPLPHRGPCR
jgi:hypothetical protein